MTLPFLPLVGIDIGASAIKIAELSGSGSTRTLKAIGMEMLPAHAVIHGIVQDTEAVQNTILTLLEKLKINPAGRRAAVALPSSAVEIKRVLIDASKSDLDEVMTYEIEQYFQGEISDLYFEYQEMVGWCEDPTKVPVLVVGAQRGAINQVLEVMRGCGLRTGVVDCESLCAANIFEFTYPLVTNTLTALVDIGAHSTKVTLFLNGQALFAKHMTFGGAEYTKQVMQALTIENENAEAVKIAMSLGQAAVPEPVQRLVNDLNQTFVAELHSVLKLYFDSSVPIPGVTGLAAIMLSGGGAGILSLESSLGAAFQVPVQTLNPFSRMNVNPRKFEMDYLLMQGHVYSVALGLALRKVKDDKK